MIAKEQIRHRADDDAALRHTTLTTPDGPFTIVSDDDAVLASGWTDDLDSLIALIHPDLRTEPRSGSDSAPGPGRESAAGTAAESVGVVHVLSRARQAVLDYYAGDHSAPDDVPVRQRSGPYRERAWGVLRDVGPAETLTYSAYAERTGRPSAVRAAAGACAYNAAALFVPCHRILRTDGGLGGFRYGTAIKESLLRRERQAASGS